MGLRFSTANVLTPWFEVFKTPSEQRQYRVLVEHETLFVCKLSFAACSPVFKAALFGEFKESHENEFKFSDKTLIHVIEMFACTFTMSAHEGKLTSQIYAMGYGGWVFNWGKPDFSLSRFDFDYGKKLNVT